MIFTLIGTVMLGVTAASLVFIFGRVLKRRLPRWLIPVAAGGAMMGFIIWSDYAYFARTAAALPDGMRVVSFQTSTSMIRPWTLIAPPVNRFMAMAGQRTHPDWPGYVLTELLFLQRWYPTRPVAQLIDCGGERRADVELDDLAAGEPEALDWFPLARDHALWQAACPDPADEPPAG